jgi:glycopeptide antibiotics resistance protein
MGFGHVPGLGPGWPPILPGLIVSLLVATALATRAGRWLGCSAVHAWLLLVSFGVILAITLTPSAWVLDGGAIETITCDLSRIGPASWQVYRHLGDPTLNVLMFIPLGLALGALRRRPHRTALVVLAFALPWAIETTQAFAVFLDRACQAGDVFDNSAGLAIGLAAGWIVATLLRRLRG